MPEIVAKINFEVGGKNVLGDAFDKPLKSMDELTAKLNKIGSAKFGTVIDGVGTITRETKEAATMTRQYFDHLSQVVGVDFSQLSSKIKEVNLQMSRGEKRSWQVTERGERLRTMKPSGKGMLQVDFMEKFQRDLSFEINKALQQVSQTMRAMPQTVQVGEFRARFAENINALMNKTVGELKATFETGKLDPGVAQEIMRNFNLALNQLKNDSRNFASDMKASTKSVEDAKKAIGGAQKTVTQNMELATRKAYQHISQSFEGLKGVNVEKFQQELRAEIEGHLNKMRERVAQAAMKGELPEKAAEITEAYKLGMNDILHRAKVFASNAKVSGENFGEIIRTVDALKYKLVGELRHAQEKLSGEVPSQVAELDAKAKSYLQNMLTSAQVLEDAGMLSKGATKEIAGVMSRAIGDYVHNMRQTTNGLANIAKQAASEAARSDKTTLSLIHDIAKSKEEIFSKISSTINKEINKLQMEKVTTNPLRASNIDKYIKALQEFHMSLATELDKAKPQAHRDIRKMTDDILTGLYTGVETIKRQRAVEPKMGLSKALFNRASMQSFAAVAGMQMQNIGTQMQAMIESSRFKGRLTSSLTNVFMSAFMVTKFAIFREVANIFGTVIEIMAETLMEIPRFLMALVASVFKAVGTMLVKGAATTMFLMMSAALSPLTVGISAVLAAVVGAVTMVMTLLTELGSFISSIMKSIFSLIGSVVRLGVMMVTSVIKGVVNTIQGLFKGLWEGLKKGFEGFIDFLKQGFDTLVSLVKQSMSEFAGVSEYATRAFKETVGVSGQALSQFEGLMGRLRSGFGFTREDVGEAMYDVVSSGFRDIAKAKEISAAASRLALADESDLKTATNAMITALQNFSMRGETAETIVNKLAAATTLGRMTMGELGNAMKSVMGISSRANLSFQDTMLSLSMLTRTFGRGSIEEGTRYFNRFVEAIAMPIGKARKELEELGITFKGVGKGASFGEDIIGIVEKVAKLDFEKARKVFTTIQSRRAWLSLTQDIEQFKGMFKDFGTIAENVGWQFEMMFNTPTRLFKRLQETMRTFMAIIGGAIWNAISGTVKQLAIHLNKLVLLLQSTAVKKFFRAFADWARPIINEVMKPILALFMELETFLASGKNFGAIFKTEAAMKLQAVIINLIRQVKSMLATMFGLIARTDELLGVWERLKSVLSVVGDYLSASTWEDWATAGVNAVMLIVNMFKASFTSTDLMKEFNSLFLKLVASFKVMAKEIFMIFAKVFPPIGNFLMATIGDSIRMGIQEGFIDGLSGMVSFLASDKKIGGIFSKIFGLDELNRDVVNTLESWKRGLRFNQTFRGAALDKTVRTHEPGGVKQRIGSGLQTATGGVTGGVIGIPVAITRVLQKTLSAAIIGVGKGTSFATTGGFQARTEEEYGILADILKKNSRILQDAFAELRKQDPGDRQYELITRLIRDVAAGKKIEDFGEIDPRTVIDEFVTSLASASMAAGAEGLGSAAMNVLGSVATEMAEEFNRARRVSGYATSAATGFAEMNLMPELKNIWQVTKDVGGDTKEVLGKVLAEARKIGGFVSPQQIGDLLRSKTGDVPAPVGTGARKRALELNALEAQVKHLQGVYDRAEATVAQINARRAGWGEGPMGPDDMHMQEMERKKAVLAEVKAKRDALLRGETLEDIREAAREEGKRSYEEKLGTVPIKKLEKTFDDLTLEETNLIKRISDLQGTIEQINTDRASRDQREIGTKLLDEESVLVVELNRLRSVYEKVSQKRGLVETEVGRRKAGDKKVEERRKELAALPGEDRAARQREFDRQDLAEKEKHLSEQITALEGKNGVSDVEKRRLEELKREKAALEPEIKKSAIEERKEVEKTEAEAKRKEALDATISVAKSVNAQLTEIKLIRNINEKQLAMLAINTKFVGNIGGIIHATIGKGLVGGFKTSPEELATVGEVV